MPNLLVANVNNENMLADRSVVTYEFACATAMTAMKLAWFAEPGDIVVMPEPWSDEMKEYASSIKGFSVADEIDFISPNTERGGVGILSFDSLHDPDLIAKVRRSLNGYADDYSLTPYYYDRSITSFARAVGVEIAEEEFRSSGGHELFNDKRVFRNLALSRGIPLARGEICSSDVQLALAFERLIEETGAVIVKRIVQANCLGNLIVSKTRDIACQGAPEMISVGKRWTLERTAEEAWRRLANGSATHLVVEVYHPVSAVCYAEFEIKSDVKNPVFLNWGEQRMEPLFAGFDIPGTIPPYQAAKFISGATDLVRLAQELGFVGLIDVDGIITESGEVLFSEINGRFGGVSHLHYLAEKLVGVDYGDTKTVFYEKQDCVATVQRSAADSQCK